MQLSDTQCQRQQYCRIIIIVTQGQAGLRLASLQHKLTRRQRHRPSLTLESCEGGLLDRFIKNKQGNGGRNRERGQREGEGEGGETGGRERQSERIKTEKMSEGEGVLSVRHSPLARTLPALLSCYASLTLDNGRRGKGRGRRD